MTPRFITYCILWLTALYAGASGYRYVDGKGLEFQWSVGYKTGISSGQANAYVGMTQKAFTVTRINEASPSYATTNATGYALAANSTYYTYHPYKWQEKFDATAIVCSYKDQAQVGNNNPDGLTPHDLCIGKIAQANASSCTIEYNHIGSVIRIEIESPATTVMTSMHLSAESYCIPATATANLLTQQTMFSDYTDRISLVLEQMTVSKGEKVTTYIMMPSVNLSNQRLTLSLKDNNGKTYTYPSLYGPNMKPGRLYRIQMKGISPKPSSAKGMNKAESPLEYPTVHTSDILIDNGYNGTIDIITNIDHQTVMPQRRISYDASGIMQTKGRGLTITTDKDGNVRKYIAR